MEKSAANLEFREIVLSNKKIVMPAYQRAYSWDEKQLKEFLNDLIEIEQKKYYFGHFIIEEQDEIYEIVDGQQRITTFVLFVLAAKLYLNYELDSNIKEFISNRFTTIGYDNLRFKNLVENIIDSNKLIKLEIEETSSFIRIYNAIKIFQNIFINKNLKITNLVSTLLNSEISIHITKDKKVAVQIFELQNSRGIGLDLIEKVKAKLMKEIYLHSQNEDSDKVISEMQEIFAEIYHLEEKTKEIHIRGDLKLENILFHHLRVIDDKVKIKEISLIEPSTNGKREDNVMLYLNKRIRSMPSPVDKTNYVLNLSKKLLLSVKFVSEKFKLLDEMNPLFGDCIILDRNHSLELFLILFHQNKLENIVLKNWELFLYTRDFHNKYHALKGKRDNFQWLFSRIIVNNNEDENIDQTNKILNNFIEKGFRRDKMDEDDLQITFNNHILNNKNNISNNAYNFRKEKMSYLLYKFEISQDDGIRKCLREIYNKGKALEHILPISWELNWIDEDLDTEKKGKFQKDITEKINGIGNLLLIDTSENSSKGSNKPSNKVYKLNKASYLLHNSNRDKWNDSCNWENLINDRSNTIYTFMKEYFKY